MQIPVRKIGADGTRRKRKKDVLPHCAAVYGSLLRSGRSVARAATDPATAAASDDAGMIEAMGHEVHVVAGAPEALKITRPLDLAVAELLLAGGGE